MERSRYRTYTTVDLSAVRHNYEVVRGQLKENCKIMSVVKADGYGHGAVKVAKTLQDSDYFAVACLDEALELRENGIKTPILILGYTSPEETVKLLDQNLTQCVFSEEYADDLHAALPKGAKLKVHIKIDTAMSRLGFYAHNEETVKETAKILKELIRRTEKLEYEGIFTHFTSSEDPSLPHTKEQFVLFKRVLELLEEDGISIPLRHCANSGAIFLYPEMHLDMVRPGIVLYGYFPDPSSDFGLKPALEWKAYVAQIHRLQAGDTVSYNRTFRATEPMEVATVCVGYADGLHRTLSNGATVLINGKKASILGRICMDQCVIDVTDIPTACGNTVTLLGQDGSHRQTASDLAKQAGTVHYEVLCSIGKRIPRFYIEK